MMEESVTRRLSDKATAIRRSVIEMLYTVQSGHPGASLSIADVLAVLYFHELRVDPQNPKAQDRDRLIVSKGHAAPALYAALAEAGYFPKSELSGLRKINSLLQGHPCIRIPGVDLTTGSLGLGLSGSVGIALGGRMRKSPARVYTILGDGEQNEGQVWEAAMAAAHFGLDNLVAITDRNKYQNDGPTGTAMQMEPFSDKWRAFGWHVIEIDGHDIPSIIGAFDIARAKKGCPTMIIAHTVKGKGASYLLDRPDLHYTPPTREQRDSALNDLEV